MSSFVKASGGITPNSADPGEEFPFLHTITVVDRVVSVDKPELVQNNIKTETVTLNLDSEWDGLSTVINIGNDSPVSVIWSGEPVVIPAELMTTVGSLDVSVVGYGDDGGIRAVTKQAQSIFNVVASGFVEGDEAVPDPTTVLGQLVQAADNANQAADRFNKASADIEGIGPAIEKVQTSEVNAKHSETNAAASAESASQSASTASASAEAAGTSETNAATSASSASEASTAAKASETNAAASATAAQNAVNGFGLEVGTTTTGEPGTDAAVSITKQGTKYVADFTIPRGEQGVGGTDNVLIGTASGTVASANDSYSAPRQIRVHGDATVANPEKLVVRTNNFFPNFHGTTQNGITLTQDSEGVYHMDGVAITAERVMLSAKANVPPGDYVFKHSASRSGIDGYINASGFYGASSTTGVKLSITSSMASYFNIRYAGLQQGVEYHDTLQIVLTSGTDIPSDFPKNESSEVALPSGLNLVDGDTLVIDSDGSTRITHSSGEPTPSTPVALPKIPAPTFAIYAEGGSTRPTVDVDYERDINIVINKLEQAIAVQSATMKVNQLTD